MTAASELADRLEAYGYENDGEGLTADQCVTMIDDVLDGLPLILSSLRKIEVMEAAGAALLASNDKTVSAMLGERDRIRSAEIARVGSVEFTDLLETFRQAVTGEA